MDRTIPNLVANICKNKTSYVRSLARESPHRRQKQVTVKGTERFSSYNEEKRTPWACYNEN